MGDINLLGMIRKIKNSISGFISTSDKATKSKFGIVKVGDNISVSSGTISVPVATEDTYGVVKAGGSGGVTVDLLWTGNISANDYKDITSAILHPVNDYKLLFCGYSDKSANPSLIPIFVGNMKIGQYDDNYMYFGTNNSESASIRVYNNTVKITSSANKTGLCLYGIK